MNYSPNSSLREGTLREENFFHPGFLSEDTLLRVHTEDYWKKLQEQSLPRKEARKIGFPMTSALVHRGRYIAQGSIQCALHARQYGVALNIAGGTHHAYADHGEGFCVFNDFALASQYLLDQQIVQKVLIVDLDVHQGNGTAHIFRAEPRVFTFSMHGEKNYPLRKERSDLDIGLPDGISDQPYLRILASALDAVIDETEPEHIFYLSGVDVLETDKLGRLQLTRRGCRERDRIVLSSALRHEIPVSISMGGGYSERLVDLIEAHANTFRVAQEVFF